MKKDQHPLNTQKTRSMRGKILDLLMQGLHLSELDGLTYGYGTSFRTRISELRALGYHITDFWDESATGARFKRYKLEDGLWNNFGGIK